MKTEERFWDKRYRRGLPSGKGSIGSYRKWKWKVINQYVNIKSLKVLDVGCGDLTFMKGKKPMEYTGIDISPSIIGRHKLEKPEWSFILTDATFRVPKRFKKDVVLAMDILFHIMDDTRFAQLLKNLNDWTGIYLFVCSWRKNPMPYLHDDYQYFRDLKECLEHLPDLELVAEHEKKGDDFNTVYVFKRKDVIE